jgi:hypothetical protein
MLKKYHIINTETQEVKELTCTWELQEGQFYQFGGLNGYWLLATDIEVETFGVS